MSQGTRNTAAGAGRLSRRAHRVRNHVALGAGGLVGAWAVFAGIESEDTIYRVSMATAYVALVLFAITLAFGPYAALRGRRYPVSADVRRDFGIWSALVAITHVVAGLQVHLRGKMWEYFVRSDNGVLLPRIDPFGAANYTGLAASTDLRCAARDVERRVTAAARNGAVALPSRAGHVGPRAHTAPRCHLPVHREAALGNGRGAVVVVCACRLAARRRKPPDERRLTEMPG